MWYGIMEYFTALYAMGGWEIRPLKVCFGKAG